MPQTPRKHRKRNILVGILVVLLLLAVAFQVFIDRWLAPVIHKRLETLIVSGSDSLYTFRLDKIDVNFWGGSVDVTNLDIKIDSLHYAEREKAKTLPALTFEINLTNGSITHIKLLQLVFKKKIDIGTITSKNAAISLSRHFRKSDKEITKGDRPLWQTLQPDIQSIFIDRILLNDINLNYSNADSAKAFRLKFEHCSATIENTKVDSASSGDTSRILFAKDISILFNELKLRTGDGLYAIEAKQLRYSSEKRLMAADDFKLHPVLGQQAFYKQVGIDKDRYSLDFPKLEMINFQLPLWISQNIMRTDTIEITKPQIAIYKDRTQKPDLRSKYGKYPHQMLQKAPFTIQVKKVKVIDGTVSYTEKNQKSGMEGKLVFNHLNGRLANITNDDEWIAANPKCIADLRGTFMNRSPIHSVFTFYLNDAKNGGFEVSADMEKVHAAELTPITVALAQASVKSFDIKELHYYIKGNERSGTGNLTMLYNNLDIELQKVDEDGDMKKKGLLSFLVNKLVVYPDNPMKDNERKAVNITTQRIGYKSFFNLVWKTLFAATKDITIRIDALKKDKTQKKKK